MAPPLLLRTYAVSTPFRLKCSEMSGACAVAGILALAQYRLFELMRAGLKLHRSKLVLQCVQYVFDLLLHLGELRV